MPSGKVHDAITLGLALPAFGCAYLATSSFVASLICGVAFLFGGLMFGPDLDTVSRPYSRWGPVRAIWLPYRYFFPHRSRFSHGLVFGALIRVIYFLGGVTLICLVSAYLYQTFNGGRLPGVGDIVQMWNPVGQGLREYFGANFLILVFAGLWAGAASHTFTDLAGSFIKTGRSGKFF
ncbi:metal-binding protein [soil metagenome]